MVINMDIIERHKISGVFWISSLAQPIRVTHIVRAWDMSPGSFPSNHIGKILANMNLLVETEDKRYFVDFSKKEVREAYKELLKKYYERGSKPDLYFKLILDNFDKFICWIEKNKWIFSIDVLKQVTERKNLEKMEGFLFPLFVFRLVVFLHILKKKGWSVEKGIKAFVYGLTIIFRDIKMIDLKKYFTEVIKEDMWELVVDTIPECEIDKTDYYEYEKGGIILQIKKIIDDIKNIFLE